MKLLFALMCVLSIGTSYSQTIDIPDKNFEKALIDLKIDSDKTLNGFVLRSDVQSVIFLDLYNKKIKCLKGIEAFSSLSYLDCRKNYLLRLDLSKNINLTTVYSDINDFVEPSNTTYVFNWFDN